MILTDDNIGDYAETMVLQVRAGGGNLDYTESSVGTIEGLLRLSDPFLQAPEMPQEKRDLVIFYNGCYLGEVMARNLGGTWRFDAENWADSSLVFAFGEGGIQVYPFHKLFRRVADGPEANDLVDYYTGLKERLASAL